MCKNPQGAPMGHWSFRRLDSSRDYHFYSELLKHNNFDAVILLGVHPIHNQFWQYPLCNVCRLWQPDELHLLLLGLVNELLHGLLKYVKGGNVKYQFDIRFTLVPPYPGLQHFSKSFDSLKSGTWQGIEIDRIIRILAVNCAPILDCSQDAGKPAAENPSNEIVMGAEQALCEFSLLVGKQNHSDLSLKALNDAVKRF